MSQNIETVLKTFIHHVIDLQNENDSAGSGFTREFRILREKQVEDKNTERFSMTEGKKDENIKKNRYKDIIPRDDRRVKLEEIPGEPGSDYINASFIDGVDGQRGYIAAQGPMPHTVNDFWRMLLQYKVEIVFMACRLKEDCKAKCEQYWSEKGGSTCFGNIKVCTESEEEIQDHFIKRQLRAEEKGAVHRLIHFQYVGWPDHNVPSSPDALRRMIENVRNHRRKFNIPMVVHCSAGCGRTGTICAIDFAWTLLDKGMVAEGFSMFEIIKSLREQRISMVQTPDQYEYTHMVMKSLCSEWLASFGKHDYENVILTKEKMESHSNVDIEQGQSNSQDPTPTNKRNSKESGDSSSSASSARPAISRKPQPQPRPDTTRPKPEISAQKPALSSQKPQGLPRNTKQPIPVYVNSVASSSGGSTPSFNNQPPSFQEKLRSRLNSQPDEFLEDSSTIAGGLPRIAKASTVGWSAMRQKTRPPLEMGMQGREEGGGAEAVVVDANVYEVVDKSKNNRGNVNAAPLYENQLMFENRPLTPDNSQVLSDGDYCNETFNGASEDKEAPALPSRQYKPDEVSQMGRQQKGSKPQGVHTETTSTHNQRQRYDNFIPSFPNTPIPINSSSSAAPKHNFHRMQQPIPITPSHTARPIAPIPPTRISDGQNVTPKSPKGHGQAVGDSSTPREVQGGQSGPFSVLTSKQNVGQPLPGWPESNAPQVPVTAKWDYPGAFTGPSVCGPADTPRGYSGGQKHIVAAPGPGQVNRGRVAETLLVFERIQRVKGPRCQPSQWANGPRSQRRL